MKVLNYTHSNWWSLYEVTYFSSLPPLLLGIGNLRACCYHDCGGGFSEAPPESNPVTFTNPVTITRYKVVNFIRQLHVFEFVSDSVRALHP